MRQAIIALALCLAVSGSAETQSNELKLLKVFDSIPSVDALQKILGSTVESITFEQLYGYELKNGLRYKMQHVEVTNSKFSISHEVLPFLKGFLPGPGSTVPFNWTSRRVGKATRHIPVPVVGFGTRLGSNMQMRVVFNKQHKIATIIMGFH